MPPQPSAKAITSYFNKLPSTSPTSATKVASTSTQATTSTSTQTSPNTISPSTGQKRSFLSDAAKKAIEAGAAEASAAKKVKTNDGKASASNSLFITHGGFDGLIEVEVADVFLMSAAKTKAVSLPKSKSREELSVALSGIKSEDADLLRLEVDTMQEEWLLALQDELTKPYFLNVSRH